MSLTIPIWLVDSGPSALPCPDDSRTFARFLTLFMVGPSGEASVGSATCVEAGRWEGAITVPNVDGVHRVSIMWGGQHLVGSPALVNVTGAFPFGPRKGEGEVGGDREGDVPGDSY